MTTIYNYIIKKINQFEDYLLQPSQSDTTKHNKHNKAQQTQKHNAAQLTPEYFNMVIDELQQQLNNI